MLTKALTDKVNEDGSPHIEWMFDESDNPGGGVMLTGPVKGEVVLSDGTRYDVTPSIIEHKAGHAGPISHHIEKLHEANGQLCVLRGWGSPVHTCTEACGAEVG